MTKAGLVTIGQSPRSDVVPEIRGVLGAGIEVVEKGALDGLEMADVQALRPRAGEPVLVTRMRNGTEVKVAEKEITGRLLRCVADLQSEERIKVVMVLCTGEFPEVESRIPVLRPGRIMQSAVRSISERGRLGLVVPCPEQIHPLSERWHSTGLQVAAEAVSPYTAATAELTAAACRLRDSGVDIVVLDCMGFTRGMKTIFREVVGKPVLLPRTLLARFAREMLES